MTLQKEKIRHVKHILKISLLVFWMLCFVAGIVGTIYFLRIHTPEEAIVLMEGFIRQNTLGIIFGAFVLYFVRSIIFVPVSVLGAALGIVLSDNPILAISIAGIGAFLSAILSFGIARALGREWVAEHESDRLRYFDEKVKKRGFFTILILRLLLFIPFDLINILSGVSGIRLVSYAAATFIGIWPEVAVQVLIGSAVLNPKNIIFLIAIALAILALTYFLKTHSHFRDILNPKKQYKKLKEKRQQKKSL